MRVGTFPECDGGSPTYQGCPSLSLSFSRRSFGGRGGQTLASARPAPASSKFSAGGLGKGQVGSGWGQFNVDRVRFLDRLLSLQRRI